MNKIEREQPDLSVLEHSQALFAQSMLSPSDVAAALSLFDSSDAAKTIDRLGLYRGNLLAIWRDTLKKAYPVFYQLVGEEFFEGMAREYGRKHPSQSGDLHLFGAELAEFIQVECHELLMDYPYFYDMLRLEWLLHQSYYAQDVHAFSALDLQQLDQTTIMDLKLALCPANSLWMSDYACSQIWHAHQAESQIEFPTNIKAKEFCLIVRQGWRVQLLNLNAAEFYAIQAIVNGETLGSALEKALEIDPNFDVAGHFSIWLKQELLKKTTD